MNMTVNRAWKTGIALGTMLLFAAPAQADEAGVKSAASKLVKYASAVSKVKTKGAEAASSFSDDPAKCTAAISDAEKAGATDTTRLYAFGWPTDVPSYTSDKGGASITLAAGRGVCTDYTTWRPRAQSAGAILIVAKHFKTAKDHGTGFGKFVVDDGKKCLEVMKNLDAASLAVEMMIGTEPMTLEKGREMCQKLVDDGAGQATAKAEVAAKKKAEIEAKWSAVGMKGDRLNLFVENELNSGGYDWYLKGCRKTLTDPKALAKAKVLFHWSSGGNGGWLVTKYTFKGNTYNEAATEYAFEDKAYKGCK